MMIPLQMEPVEELAPIEVIRDEAGWHQPGHVEPIDGSKLKAEEVQRFSCHSRLSYVGGRVWTWHTTQRYPWDLKVERRLKNKRARQARRLNRP